MSSPRSLYLQIGENELHVTEWGDPGAPALIMWHGLARTGRDFDTLAAHLADRYRIICPDTLGRGLSGWSKQPEQDYTLAAYMGHAVLMLDALGIGRCDWIGTSMGGALGMLLAAGPLKERLGKLVMSDVGPKLAPEAVERIRAYVTAMPDFATLREFEAFLRLVYAPFGCLTDAEWRLMAETSARRRDDGRITSHYDPEVMRIFASHTGDYDLWPVYDALSCPTLVLRGETSDLLTPEVADEMTRRGPKARLVTVAGCGHAPPMNTPDQITVVEAFLRA
ncbi:Hydrolase or acyltransferase [Candidatus Terasakiella magnetica]|nr:Hydrolase or acyltransferase [Candidatus Terasakiella magnetica]